MRRSASFVLAMFLLGCVGAPDAAAPPPEGASEAQTPPSTSAEPERAAALEPGDYVLPELGAPSPPPAPLALSSRSPAIVRLAKAAAACKATQGEIAYDCKALQRWLDEGDAFADGKGDLTLLSLLEDADPKLRQVAAWKGLSEGRTFLANKENARRLIAIAAKERAAPTAKHLGRWFRDVMADTLGLESELFALTDHVLTTFRHDLAWNVPLGTPQVSAFGLIIVEKLASDADERVRISTIRRLSTAREPREGLCRLLGRALERTDASGVEALEVIATGACDALMPRMLAALESRARDVPSKPSLSDSGKFSGLGHAAAALCTRKPDVDESAKKRAFAVGATLLEKDECWIRVSAVDALVACDPSSTRPLIEPFADGPCMDLGRAVKEALKKVP